MYEAHFGLARRPFSMAPDPDFLFLCGRHALALTLLQYGLEGAGQVTVLTGEVGVGKTMLLHTLLRKMEGRYDVGRLANTCVQGEELLRWTCLAFGLPHEARSDAMLYEGFAGYLARNRAAGRGTLLLVDEAQNLEPGALERLRLLSNTNVDADEALHLLIVGQPELRRRLQHPAMRALRQRVGVDYHLPPFSNAETRAYIEHRLRVAGGDAAIFTEGALGSIHEAAGGLPRAINVLGEFSLVYGFATGQRTIDEGLVADVVRERLAAATIACDTDLSAAHRAPDSLP